MNSEPSAAPHDFTAAELAATIGTAIGVPTRTPPPAAAPDDDTPPEEGGLSSPSDATNADDAATTSEEGGLSSPSDGLERPPSDQAAAPDDLAAAQQRIADLEAQLNEMRNSEFGIRNDNPANQQPSAPTPASGIPQSEIRIPHSADDEIASAETPEQLLALQTKFQNLEDLALDNPEGYETTNAVGEPITYTPEQMRSLARTARLALRQLPRQAQQLQQRAQYDAQADKLFPDYANPKSNLSRYYATLRQDPALRRIPYLKLVLGDAEAGRLARESKAQTPAHALPGKPITPAPRTPPTLPAGSARRPATTATTAQARAQAAAQNLAKSKGAAEDLASAISTRYAL